MLSWHVSFIWPIIAQNYFYFQLNIKKIKTGFPFSFGPHLQISPLLNTVISQMPLVCSITGSLSFILHICSALIGFKPACTWHPSFWFLIHLRATSWQCFLYSVCFFHLFPEGLVPHHIAALFKGILQSSIKYFFVIPVMPNWSVAR